MSKNEIEIILSFLCIVIPNENLEKYIRDLREVLADVMKITEVGLHQLTELHMEF